jgi:hypothetical protein
VTAEAAGTRRHDILNDLPLPGEAFQLGWITDLRYLSDGLMNRNRRVHLIAQRAVLVMSAGCPGHAVPG